MQPAVGHGNPDPGLGGFGQAFVVLAEAPGQHLEARTRLGTADALPFPGPGRSDPVPELGAGVAGIRPAVLPLGEDEPGTVPVLKVGGVHDHGQQPPHRVDHEMALAPRDLLAGVGSDGLSRMAALAVACRPARRRTRDRKAS